jgi:hypothetical protein
MKKRGEAWLEVERGGDTEVKIEEKQGKKSI